jgi:hypothetical protein
MATKRVIKNIKTKRMFVTGSSRSTGTDTILASSYNEMSNSFANNSYLDGDGNNYGSMAGLIWVMNEMKEDIEDIHSEVSQSVYVSNMNSGSTISKIHTFTSRDTTPSVAGGSIFKTGNDRPISIRNFDDGTEGQQITILINDANTDFTHDTRFLILNGAVNWTAATTNDSITFINNGSKWIETNRSDNT